MNVKSGVAPLLFACMMGASSAANADAYRDDRYFNPFEQNPSAATNDMRAHRSSRQVRHARHAQKLHTRDVAARFEKQTVRIEEPARSTDLSSLVAAKAAAHGVPAALANAVVRVESNYNPRVTGRAGEVGLMQIKYQTARGLGYTGTRAALYDPATNLEWGMRYLAGAQRLAGGSLCGTLARYQGGHGTRDARTSHNYCGRVHTALSSRGA
jgi:soluble lytic murein transglycosylase-like protein